ncbi:cupin domain-containing protein [Halospeciosus flavus]|uniref:Cupin domain-containing protein n=1 Tax=Halospeciosus flavus TaxID=3032283 RepID=A0ABD5Z873_9EURY|nr:cupin domain-containing protein [Halospeciosus flavus]
MQTVDLSAQDVVEAVDGVYLAQLAVGEQMSVQHFHIQPDAEVPTHEHPHEQTGFIYEGELTFLVGEEGEETEHVVTAGESYTIPGDEPHAARNLGDDPVRGVDIFAPPRENPAWQE